VSSFFAALSAALECGDLAPLWIPHINIEISSDKATLIQRMPDTLTLHFPAVSRYPQSSGLEVSFTPISADELSVSISATIYTSLNSAGPLELNTRTPCYGYDLAEFARELEQFHARYDGGARFLNQLGSFELRLTLADKARGILDVAARYEHDTECISPVELQCFRLEQSYLPGLLSDIRRFLAESGISTTHPFHREPSA